MLLAEELALIAVRPAAVLSDMSRGLQRRLGTSTRDTAVSALADAGVLGPATGALLPKRARLLAVVAPERAARRHARGRIDHALDGSDLEPVGRIVRRVIKDAVAATVVVAG